MNKKQTKFVFFFLIITTQFFHNIKASQYNPYIYLFKPSKDEPNLSNPSISFSAGYTKTAFDSNGKTVPFLEQYGPEDFLERFVNKLLGPDNLNSAGQGLISGNYHFKQYHISYEQHMYHQLIFAGLIAIQDLTITDIKARFITNESPLTSDQMTYLEKLDQKIPQTINQTGLYTANIYFGYNEKLINFNHIDSLQVLLFVGISTPQAMKKNNQSILQFDCSANFHFGYPIIGTIEVDVRDWFGLGFSGIVIPFQPVTQMIPINRTSENNNLLFSQSTLAKIDQNPFFTGTIYTELYKPSAGLTGTLAYTYSQYLQSKITPIDTIQFPIAHANKSIARDGYSLGELLLQLDIDCSYKDKKLAPIISFFVSIPIIGTLYQKLLFYGGASTFQISYTF